ncbi:MAG TPA: hypothetical protein VHV75_06200 [Solirubrobacteraceae bacterium]|jgi:hypothetical protein|nr:hypothetical protein [Solirubrobacteraceae bacterium]
MRKLTLAAVLVAALVCAPLAFAASSPTVSASAATKIGTTSGTLHGTVNPNGLATTYQFEYGATNTLGSFSPATAAGAGSGTAAVAESSKLTGLAPDTTYYYELVASNSAGTSTTPVETFKTTGNPAPGATTDPAAGIGRYVATLVGTISPNNQATTYWFDYGLTDTYGFQTAVKSLPAGSTPTTVSAVLPGIEPGTVFHYRLVASHGSTSITYGTDVAFGTFPWPRPHTSLKLAVSPRSAKKTPASFTARGQIGLAYTTPAALGCKGTVTITYYAGKRQLATARAAVASNCAYSARTRIGRTAKGQLTVKARYGGDTYQAPATKRAVVKVG